MARNNSVELRNEFDEIFDQISNSAQGALSVGTKKAAQDAVRILKKYKFDTGRYSKGWGFKRNGPSSYTVHNKKSYYLTHLLEKGHEVIAGGKAIGKRTEAQEHIKPTEEKIKNSIEDYVMEELDRRL